MQAETSSASQRQSIESAVNCTRNQQGISLPSVHSRSVLPPVCSTVHNVNLSGLPGASNQSEEHDVIRETAVRRSTLSGGTRRSGSISIQNPDSLGPHVTAGTTRQRNVPAMIARTGDLHCSGQETTSCVIVRQLSMIRKDVSLLTEILTQILELLKKKHLQRMQQFEKTQEIINSFRSNEATESRAYSVRRYQSRLPAILFQAFLLLLTLFLVINKQETKLASVSLQLPCY